MRFCPASAAPLLLLTALALLCLNPYRADAEAVSAVVAANGQDSLHGFVVYTQTDAVSDGAGGVRRESCLTWESLPDHQVRRLIGPEHPQLSQGIIGPAALDATGAFVAFLAGGQSTQPSTAPRRLWILRLSDGRLTPCLAGAAVRDYQWSPTGSRLAVAAKMASINSLFLVDPATGKSVGTGIRNPQTWAWSPDARSIAFTENGNNRLCLFSLTASRALFRWSLAAPTDVTLCFASPLTLLVLQGKTLYRAATGHPLARESPLLQDPLEMGQAALSPRSDLLAFETSVNYTGEDPRSALPLAVDRSLHLYAVKSRRITMLRQWTDSQTFFHTTESILGWSRDGRFLLITRPPDDPKSAGLQVLAISRAGKSRTVFTTAASVTSLDWHEGS